LAPLIFSFLRKNSVDSLIGGSGAKFHKGSIPKAIKKVFLGEKNST
jgi:hypothetical protein